MLSTANKKNNPNRLIVNQNVRVLIYLCEFWEFYTMLFPLQQILRLKTQLQHISKRKHYIDEYAVEFVLYLLML